MGRNILIGVLVLLLLAVILSVTGNAMGWFGGTSAPSPVPGPAAPADPGQPALPAEPVEDGGAEQLPDEPLPPTPADPVPADEPPPAPAAVDFAHNDPGALVPGSGSGYLDRTVWSPQMCFPFEEAGYANSQVYGPGGSMGPAGTSQCDTVAYSLPWRDNFCESRGYASPLCANGKGHQGQDIRPATCKKAIHWVVAAEAGVITDIGSYTVTLTASASPHLVYRYLHMQMDQLSVHEGSVVAKGGRLGKSSNNFGGTATTIHTHFEIRAGVAGTSTDGKPVVVHTFLPPYLSLVEAYRRKLNGQACG
jgi:murein DD-endopeptidase MepM/ murein hydrolase activator NlpD